jgi:hypothetical protein
MVKYVTAQNDISDRRRWTAVALLSGGLLVGFVGNALSLYPWLPGFSAISSRAYLTESVTLPNNYHRPIAPM